MSTPVAELLTCIDFKEPPTRTIDNHVPVFVIPLVLNISMCNGYDGETNLLEAIIKTRPDQTKAYLVWQTLRHAGPYPPLTGFERNFANLDSADKIAFAIASKGNQILTELETKYKYEPEMLQALQRTLFGTQISIEALIELDMIMMQTVSRLGAQMGQEGMGLRVEAERLVQKHPGINYSWRVYSTEATNPGDLIAVRQKYILPQLQHSHFLDQPTTTEFVFPAHKVDVNPYVFMDKLGQMGHPLVRSLLGMLNESRYVQ